MLLHDRQVQGITRGNLPVSHDNLFRALGSGPVNGQHFVSNTKQCIECGLDGIAAIYGHIPVQDLLQDLGIGNEALPVTDQVFEQTLRVGLVRMRCADEVHGDIRVDQNQG